MKKLCLSLLLVTQCSHLLYSMDDSCEDNCKRDYQRRMKFVDCKNGIYCDYNVLCVGLSGESPSERAERMRQNATYNMLLLKRCLKKCDKK